MKSEDMSLGESLLDYDKGGTLPLHMPGHKRNTKMLGTQLPWEMDVTEVGPFDDLHNASGMLKSSMERAALLFGARRSFYLVNGSSSGLLAAINALPRRSKTILVARNCHQSVFHAIELAGFYPVVLEPAFDASMGVYTKVSEEAVSLAAEQFPKASGVILTSPTYEGFVSDIAQIKGVLAQYDIPLVVDQAHGAHFGFDQYFPQSAVKMGADIVVQSLHKTLPALTQSAILHVCSDAVCELELERQLRIFETSSPSYVLLASMDFCVRTLETNARAWFGGYAEALRAFYAKTARLEKLRIHRADDPSKINVSSISLGMTGFELMDKLLENGVLAEMASEKFCLLMTSVCDEPSTFDRLFEVLSLLDKMPTKYLELKPQPAPLKLDQSLSLREAMGGECKMLPVGECEGKICAEYLWVYPPGVPLVLPGQRLSREAICRIVEVPNIRSTYGGLPGAIRMVLTK